MTQRSFPDETRQDRERKFHDDLWAAADFVREDAGKFYEINATSRAQYEALIDARAAGSVCIEYGCAQGADCIRLIDSAERVVGFDISEVVVKQARANAAAASRSEAVEFVTAEAENLDFDDGTFDLAFGESVLHHLELAPALAEMTRILKPNGSAVFLEPLGHNRIINWYRDRTPEMRSPDEHPLMRDELSLIRSHFRESTLRFFHLTSLAAVPLRSTRSFKRVVSMLDRVDQGIVRVAPRMAYQAWVCVMVLQGPRKEA